VSRGHEMDVYERKSVRKSRYQRPDISFCAKKPAAKPRQNLEYLNFELKRIDRAAIGSANRATFRVGQRAFVLIRDQQRVIQDLSVSPMLQSRARN
jgi:hypothetical protein